MIARTCLDRIVNIGGKRFRLAPPSVGQAVQLLHVIRSSEDSQDESLLIELVCGLDWSPDIAINRGLIRQAMHHSPGQFLSMIDKALVQGYDPRAIAKKVNSDSKTGQIDWSQAIERYREVFGGSRWEVWTQVPFSFFLESLANIAPERARKNIDRAIAYNPSKKTINSWKKDLAAGKSKPKKDTVDMMFDDLSPQELEKERQLSRQHAQSGEKPKEDK